MARSAGDVLTLGHGVQALPRLGEGGYFQAIVRCGVGRAGHGICHGRRHDRGRKRGLNQATGRSKGGMTTKILALTDALGSLVRFLLLPGHHFDIVGIVLLIAGVEFGALLADKAFDSNAIISSTRVAPRSSYLSIHAARAPPQSTMYKTMYKWRHLIENFFCKLKEFKRIAMRADKNNQTGPA